MKTTNVLGLMVSVCAFSLIHLSKSHAQLSGTWTNKANLTKQGRDFGVAVLNGKIYLAGGFCGANCNLATLDEYNPATDSWTNKANMQAERYAPAAAALNGKIFALGGYGQSGILPTVEQYDPASDTWTNKASMLQARYAHQAVVNNG